MNPKTKKILAREFLILVGSVLLGVLFYIGTLISDYYIDSQIKDLNDELVANKEKQEKIDSLIPTYQQKIEKQKWVFKEFKKISDEISHDNFKTFWNRLLDLNQKDSIIATWKYYKNNGIDYTMFSDIKNGEHLKQIVNNNIITEKDKKNKAKNIQDKAKNIEVKHDKILNEIDNLEKKKFKSSKEQLNFSVTCLLIIITIVFLLRWLIIGIRWSISTLKDRD